MDTINKLWAYLAALSPEIASGLIGTTIILFAISGLLVWMKGLPISVKVYVTPMVLMGVAWVLRWLSDVFGQGWLSVGFCLTSLTAAVWALVMIIIVFWGGRK